MSFHIQLTSSAARELKAIRVYDRRIIVDEMETQLCQQPIIATRNRKPLSGVSPSFEYVPPLWELRVGDYRAYYDVDLDAEKVYVRAIRRKTSDQTTEGLVA